MSRPASGPVREASRTPPPHAGAFRKGTHIADCKPLPPDWVLGEPLRVGDRVAFTGCDQDQRTYLEQRALASGVRVMGNASKRTALLVSDGTYEGNKAAAAQLLGTRMVHPDQFAVLVNHIQPPATR